MAKVKLKNYKIWLPLAAVTVLFVIAFTYSPEPSSVPLEYYSHQFEVREMEKLTTFEGASNVCDMAIVENSKAILKFMKENVKIGSTVGNWKTTYAYGDDYIFFPLQKESILDLYTTEGLSISYAYRNLSTNQVLLVYTHHNRFMSDASFDERVVCNLDENNEIIKFYVSAKVDPAS